jgi:predicted phage baseplate assembly protein
VKLPEIQLDDRRFQDLVSEARLRINRSCPEWTEHNVSDPGITLIELFAWMTEMTIYRLNRVPDKLHVTLLELLGIQLDGPSAAAADVRFRLVEPPTEPLTITGGETEVATGRTASEEPVVFQVDEDFTIPSARPAAYVLQRGGQIKDVGVADGQARPQGADQMPFGNPPAVGDALYIGFDEPLGRLLMQIDVDASPARGAGVNPEDPPLRWEVSQGDNNWEEAVVLEDLTGGFNYGAGAVELQLPPRSAVQPLGGHRMHWLRCRIDDKTRHGGAATTYTQAPEIYSITGAPIGALLATSHAAQEVNEMLGVSDGTPGQTFPLRYSPVLKPHTGETLEVRDPESGDWAAWELRPDFVTSTEFDRHYTLNPVGGEIELGPAIRETDGGWTQYGSIPPKGAVLRFTRYRHGGGRGGNVAAGALNVMRSALPGIDSVSNPVAASGGVDPEALDHARQRAAMEIRTRYRAVTA